MLLCFFSSSRNKSLYRSLFLSSICLSLPGCEMRRFIIRNNHLRLQQRRSIDSLISKLCTNFKRKHTQPHEDCGLRNGFANWLMSQSKKHFALTIDQIKWNCAWISGHLRKIFRAICLVFWGEFLGIFDSIDLRDTFSFFSCSFVCPFRFVCLFVL